MSISRLARLSALAFSLATDGYIIWDPKAQEWTEAPAYPCAVWQECLDNFEIWESADGGRSHFDPTADKSDAIDAAAAIAERYQLDFRLDYYGMSISNPWEASLCDKNDYLQIVLGEADTASLAILCLIERLNQEDWFQQRVKETNDGR